MNVQWYCKKHGAHYPPCYICETERLRRENEQLRAEIDRLKRGVWISVKERLPDRNTPILIAANGRVYTATLFEANGIEYWSVNNRGNTDDPSTKVERVNTKAIAHWMPLPEPPEKEASG